LELAVHQCRLVDVVVVAGGVAASSGGDAHLDQGKSDQG
jgi:hypothetical protein